MLKEELVEISRGSQGASVGGDVGYRVSPSADCEFGLDGSHVVGISVVSARFCGGVLVLLNP